MIRRAAASRTVALLCISGLMLMMGACGGGDSQTPSPSIPVSAQPTDTAPVDPTPAPARSTAPPSRDLWDLARRFRGLAPGASRAARQTPFGYAVGDSQQFFLVNLNVPEPVTITATVRLITDHAYFFIEDGVAFSPSSLGRIGADFESKVYPVIRAAVGSEWTPGVDADPRITILHASITGAGGYFHQGDEYPGAVVPISNEREVLYVDARILSSPGVPYDALIAHEFQHLIHFHVDPDEDSWVNEGLSQMAAEIVGGGANWFDSFLEQPDVQLNAWPEDHDMTVHYAASELFFRYLLDRFGGKERSREIAREQADGIDGVNAFLKEEGADFLTVFGDWIVANYLDADAGRYAHDGISTSVPVEMIRPGDSGSGTVSQFGADYLKIGSLAGPVAFTFDGEDATTIGIADGDGQFWWSGRGDGIDSRLTRRVDLSGLARATLRFSVWSDIERGWDYGYVAVSTDDGTTWRTLPGLHTSNYDPLKNAYGAGYTGNTGGWRDEEVDLSAYTGREVLLRFEYITDDATNLTGFAVDDIAIPELGYRERETATDWTAEGFQRTDGRLRQRFLVQAIVGDDPERVTLVSPDDHNRFEMLVDAPTTIVISGTASGTSEKAPYTWSLSRP